MATETRWVQHMSGQGARWKVVHENATDWTVEAHEGEHRRHFLPKSEYRLVPAPERWELCTDCNTRIVTLPDLPHWLRYQTCEGVIVLERKVTS